MSNLQSLTKQLNDGIVPLSDLEVIAIEYIREFPKEERMKLFDLLNRFSFAKKYSGKIKFDFKWLLEAETEYDALIDPKTDVLKGMWIG